MAGEESRDERFQEYAGEYFKRLVDGVKQAYGGKASGAQRVSSDEEQRLWKTPTSPASDEARKMGGGDAEAEAANRLYAHALKGMQTQARQEMQRAGATPQQIDQALSEQGISDAAIFKTCQRHAYELGRQNSGGSRKKETRYHNLMAKKVAATVVDGVTYETMPPEGD